MDWHVLSILLLGVSRKIHEPQLTQIFIEFLENRVVVVVVLLLYVHGKHLSHVGTVS